MVLEATKLHVVAFPFPEGGHVTPFLQFSKILANNGITVTFITTTTLLSSASKPLQDDPEFPNIHFVVFEVDPSIKERFKAAAAMKEQFEELLRSLVSPDSIAGPPSCIISDMFLGWTQATGAMYQVPWYCFFTSPALFLSMTYLMPRFHAEGRIPVQANEKPFDIPGFPPTNACDMHHMHMAGTNPETIRTWVANSQSLWEAAGVIVNSVYELESAVIDGLRNLLASKLNSTQVPSILTVGPTLLEGNIKETVEKEVSHSNHECIQWLNSQPISSVLYIAFGSVAKLPSKVLEALALGLEASGQNFLWALRVPDVSAILPAGFIARTKERGLVYPGWAPQLPILAHPAVGGFLSHIGWNSALESLCMAVPMIAWPMQAEQHMNRTLFVDILEVAVGVSKGADQPVEKDQVETAIRLLFQDERGHTLRNNVKAVSATLEAAMAPGGSSFQNLQYLIEELKSTEKS